MNMPGFTAEASLGRGAVYYCSGALTRDVFKELVVLPMQMHHPFPLPVGGYPIPGLPPAPPYSPIGGWPVAPLPQPPPGWTYPPGWTPPPGWSPPPGWPPPPPTPGGFLPVGLGGWLIVGGALVAIGLSAWRLYNWWHTPPQELGPSGPICSGTGRELALRETWDWSGWGCEESLQNAINTAWDECDRLAGKECIGQCNDPTKRCRPTMAVDTTEDHPRGLYCWTKLTFTCPCQCI